jgi:hypothetical protein
LTPVGHPQEKGGYIVVSYNCPTSCDGDLQKLNAWYKTLPPDPGGGVPYTKFIAVPFPQQKERWDVESWDWFDPLGSTLNLSPETPIRDPSGR